MPVPMKAGWVWRFFLLLGLSAPLEAAQFHGFVYEAGTGRKAPLYTLRRIETRETDGSLLISGLYETLQGREIIRQDAWVRAGQLTKYVEEQRQLGEWGVMEARDGRLRFEWSSGGTKAETGSEALPPNLVVGATSIDYLAERWRDLLAGKDIPVRLGVLERQETVGFEFALMHEGKLDGKDVVYVAFKPTSFFVSMVVKPIVMIFEKADARLLELRGRVGIKKRSGSGWKDLDTEMVYVYDDATVSTSQSGR